MKKNKANQRLEKPESEIGVNLGNPFADIKFDIPFAPEPPPPPLPPPPPPPTKEELMEAELSRADKALLEEFRKKGTCQSITTPDSDGKTSGPLLKLVIQRKGHRGKTVTLVHGLKESSMTERMQLCSEIKTALGIGARFVETVLELQGDQRQRAAEWLEGHGFRCECH